MPVLSNGFLILGVLETKLFPIFLLLWRSQTSNFHIFEVLTLAGTYLSQPILNVISIINYYILVDPTRESVVNLASSLLFWQIKIYNFL